MSKKVLIISSSLRAGSNSEILAHEAEKGALAAGNEVEFISLKDKNIKFCIGCMTCQETHKCVIKDDMPELMTKVRDADVIIFTTPIYYYEMSGQLKTFLDRCNPLYPQENNFKDVYLITTLYDDAPNASKNAANGIKGWVACFDQARFAKLLDCGSLDDPKEAAVNEDLLKKAYNLGKKI